MSNQRVAAPQSRSSAGRMPSFSPPALALLAGSCYVGKNSENHLLRHTEKTSGNLEIRTCKDEVEGDAGKVLDG